MFKWGSLEWRMGRYRKCLATSDLYQVTCGLVHCFLIWHHRTLLHRPQISFLLFFSSSLPMLSITIRWCSLVNERRRKKKKCKANSRAGVECIARGYRKTSKHTTEYTLLLFHCLKSAWKYLVLILINSDLNRTEAQWEWYCLKSHSFHLLNAWTEFNWINYHNHDNCRSI